MQEKRPVLIVGAGPTGMAAALELVRFGIPLRVVDKYAEPSGTSRALAVQARTLELMHQRGLADEMVALGNKGLFTTMYAAGKQLGQVDLRQIDSRFNYTLLLAQSETERILREKLEESGVLIERQTELVAFEQPERGSGVQAMLRKGDGSLEEFEATYLIDAEGAHSVVRRAAHLPFDGKSMPNSYALADLHVDGDVAEDQLSIFLASSGLLAAFPMGNRRFRVIATEKEAVDKDAPDPDLDYMHAMWSAGTHIPVAFRNMVWSSRFRINSRAMHQLRYRSVFFGGDSAHIHSPAGGQGMNTGIQDMMNLGWKLALVYRGLAKESLLDTYNEERMPIIRHLVEATERATDLFNSDNPVVHSLITHALPLALSFPGIQQKGATIVSQLGGNYQKSSLSENLRCEGTLQAGDRFPDVVLNEETGTRVLDLLDPSAFTAFCFGGGLEAVKHELTKLTLPIVEHTLPVASDVVRGLLGNSAVAVVRPDGYLLCTGHPSEILNQLRAWTLRWLCLASSGHSSEGTS
ncbi:FAD-dependent monooxygenase [Acidipila sp. EB88]|uniref:FAD-dependent monooxygenase n=1 Tax=Acidipila sp. EB88 TaxID=2305226 RepID=UPI0013152989|nr:FAD-dependent monooxygenase [Acidipila sp. EB88]